MKRLVLALLRRISLFVRRSPWLTEQTRGVLAKFPSLRAKLLQINSGQATSLRITPPASIRPSAFDPATPGSLSPQALDAHQIVLSTIRQKGR